MKDLHTKFSIGIYNVMKIIEEYGMAVDSQGWEIDARFDAVLKIMKVFSEMK